MFVFANIYAVGANDAKHPAGGFGTRSRDFTVTNRNDFDAKMSQTTRLA
jgi:hypothetical protein